MKPGKLKEYIKGLRTLQEFEDAIDAIEDRVTIPDTIKSSEEFKAWVREEGIKMKQRGPNGHL